MRNLSEGMRSGDLEDVILPLISVDEYQSKVDENAMTFGFFVQDQSAAEDLNRFVQKSPANIIDAEVSPAPDQHGYFIVFIEFLNSKSMAKDFDNLLEEISELSNIKEWQMRLRGEDDLVPYAEDTLAKFAEDNRDVNHDEENDVMEFFLHSDLSNVRLDENKLSLHYVGSGTLDFELVDVGAYDEIVERHSLATEPVSLDFSTAARCRRIANIIGEGYNVNRIGDFDLIQSTSSDLVLLLKS